MRFSTKLNIHYFLKDEEILEFSLTVVNYMKYGKNSCTLLDSYILKCASLSWYSTGHGECLLDTPNGRVYDLSSQLPGLIYDVNMQCELMFGPGSQVCPYLVRKHMFFVLKLPTVWKYLFRDTVILLNKEYIIYIWIFNYYKNVTFARRSYRNEK